MWMLGFKGMLIPLWVLNHWGDRSKSAELKWSSVFTTSLPWRTCLHQLGPTSNQNTHPPSKRLSCLIEFMVQRDKLLEKREPRGLDFHPSSLSSQPGKGTAKRTETFFPSLPFFHKVGVPASCKRKERTGERKCFPLWFPRFCSFNPPDLSIQAVVNQEYVKRLWSPHGGSDQRLTSPLHEASSKPIPDPLCFFLRSLVCTLAFAFKWAKPVH